MTVLPVTAALLKAVPVEGGVARLLQPVEEAHRDAGTRRGAGMSVAHGCREKRITGRAEEKDGHYGDLHSDARSRTPLARHQRAQEFPWPPSLSKKHSRPS